MKGQPPFWYPSDVWQHFGYLATASGSLKIEFLKKHKMAARGLVWPRNFLVRKWKLLIFMNHWKSAKTWTCQTKIERARAIFQFCLFWLLTIEDKGGKFLQERLWRAMIFFWNFFPTYQVNTTMGSSDEVFSSFKVLAVIYSPKTCRGLNHPPGFRNADTTCGQ